MKNEKISEDTQHKSHVDRICLNVRSSKYYYNYGMSQYNVQNPNIKTRRIIGRIQVNKIHLFLKQHYIVLLSGIRDVEHWSLHM